MNYHIFISTVRMEDNYSHDSCAIVYVTESIPGPAETNAESIELINNFNSQLSDHCNCISICDPQKCQCLLKCSGFTYGNGRLMNLDEISNQSFPLYECNNHCNCSYDCKNRIVQKGPMNGLYVKNCSEFKGLGLYTSVFIPKGMFICEYAGEIITQSQAVSRYKRNEVEKKMNYIFCLQEFSNGSVTKTFVDPSYMGNIGRYINHSCDPNCLIFPVRVNIPIPKLAIFSCQDIVPHTEITFNYGTGGAQSSWKVNSLKKCFCRSENCTGWLPFDTSNQC